MAAFNFQAMMQSLAGQPVTGMSPQDELAMRLAQAQQGQQRTFAPGSTQQLPPPAPNAPPMGPQSLMPAQSAPPTIATPGEEIVASGVQPQAVPQEAPPGPPSMGNRDYLEEAAQAAANAPQHKGMFGTRGTLRDILGTLGDAFLVNAGAKSVYAPQRQQEKLGDAMAGFSANPDAAMERLAAGGYGKEAQDLYNANETRGYHNAVTANSNATAKAARFKQYAELFSSYMGSSTPETYERLKPMLQSLKDRGELGPEFIIPDKYDSGLAKSYQEGGMPAYRQVTTAQTDRKLTEDERTHRRNEDLRQQQVNKPPAGRSAPLPTAMSQAAPILDKVRRGEKLTPGETQFLNRTAPERGKRRTPPPLPPGFK